MRPDTLLETERLTLGVLFCGVAALSFSDFVSPVYWVIVVIVAILRLWRGTAFALTEMQASLIGWAGFFWVGLELVMGRDFLVAFTDFLLILSLAVVVETATPRNHLHRLITGQFLVLAAAVLTDSVLYAIPLAAFLVLMWRASRRLYGVNISGGDLPLGAWRSDLRLAAFMLAGASLLFVLLPRIGFGTAFQNVQRQLATSGFSDQVQFGDFARLLDPTVIMRVEAGQADTEEFRRHIIGRYWRGVTLPHFTGRGWRKGQERHMQTWNAHEDVRLKDGGEAMSVSVYREAMDHPYLFVPDGLFGVRAVPARLNLTDGGSLKFSRKPKHRLRVHMRLEKRPVQARLSPPNRWETRPADSEIIAGWAARVTAAAGTKQGKLQRLVGELRSWDYDLNAPIDPERPVEMFIGQTKRGHCELFASALTLAARSLGVPARVVNGYFGGDWNDVGGFLLIRQQHAHAWVEAWIDGRWQRFDPTPAVRWQMSGVRFQDWDRVWESVKLAWYRYVLEFQNQDRTTLLSLLKQWLQAYASWLLAAGLTVMLGWAAFSKLGGFRRGQVRASWPVLDRWLRKRGVKRLPYQPLRVLPQPEGIDAERWQQFVSDWENQAFGASPGWGRWQLMRHLRALSIVRC